MRQAVVVGAGIAGICAALGLAERDLPVLLLERNGFSAGGRVAEYPATTFHYRGKTYTCSVEHGIHGWWRQYRNFLALLERHGLSDRLVDAYDQTVVFDDGRNVYRTNVGRETQITPVPEPLHHISLFFKRNILRMMKARDIPRIATLGLKVLESVRFDPWDPEYLAHYDKLNITDYQRGVPYFYQAFIRSLSRSGFFSDPQHVSLWAFMLALQHYVFLRRTDQCFAFSRDAIRNTLLDPLVEKIREAGGQLLKGVRVVEVEPLDGGGWRLHWTVGEPPASVEPETHLGTSGIIDTRQLVLALDVEGAKELQTRSPHLQSVLGDLSVFKGRRATTVKIWWARSPTNRWGDSGVFAGKSMADAYFWLHRFQDEAIAWHRETGGAVSENHVYAPDFKHDLGDDEIYQRVKRDMERSFPEVAFSAVHHVVVRNRAVHIDFPVGCAGSFPPVETAYPDLALCGDWIDGGVPVLYMERACQTGLAAANILLSHRGLPTRQILEPLPPPPHIQRLQVLLRRLGKLGLWPEMSATPATVDP